MLYTELEAEETPSKKMGRRVPDEAREDLAGP